MPCPPLFGLLIPNPQSRSFVPTRIYLIRHGESTWNAQRRWQGVADPPLSDAGRAEATRLADALHAVPLRAVYCSPPRRGGEPAVVGARAPPRGGAAGAG